MFRLTLLLCAGLFGAMAIGGQDRGQLRFGLMAQPTAPVVLPVAAVIEVAEIAPLMPATTTAVFAPSAPVMATPVALETPPAAPVEETAKILLIAAKSANVREGPGKDFAVVSRLTRGEAVLVVAEGEGVDGWSLIRIEGDGVEGYVASRLLSE
jgi:hypothetical protein